MVAVIYSLIGLLAGYGIASFVYDIDVLRTLRREKRTLCDQSAADEKVYRSV